MTPIDTALDLIRSGDTDGFARLLDEQPDVVTATDSQGMSLLMQSLYNGRADLAAMVGDRMPGLDIFAATSLGRCDVVSTLLSEDKDLANATAADGFSPLHLAAFFGGAAVMAPLLGAGARVDTPAQNPMKVLPLNSAVAAGKLDCVTALLAAGADVNAPQHQGITPLMGAAAGGKEAIVSLLLTHGADKAAKAGDGHTAADYARERGHEALLPLF